MTNAGYNDWIKAVEVKILENDLNMLKVNGGRLARRCRTQAISIQHTL